MYSLEETTAAYAALAAAEGRPPDPQRDEFLALLSLIPPRTRRVFARIAKCLLGEMTPRRRGRLLTDIERLRRRGEWPNDRSTDGVVDLLHNANTVTPTKTALAEHAVRSPEAA